VSVVGKEIEPLLKDAKPFFGGSDKVTLAEVRRIGLQQRATLIYLQALTAPFILRIYALAKHGLLPQSVISGFDGLPNFSKWAAESIKQESVTYIWDEESTVSGTKKKIESMKAQAKAGSK
jgi:glutathione S-transferase